MPYHNQPFTSGTLIVDQLTCWRGDRCLFTNMHIMLQSGEIMALIGPNGVGKSSLLMVIAGLLHSYHGTITFQNYPIRASDIFLLSVTMPFYPEVTLYDNLHFWSILNDQPKKAVDAVLDMWQLINFKDYTFAQLSRGQQQRANLSRLAFQACPIWLLDEPLTGLDQQALEIFREVTIRHLNQQGIIIMAPNINGWDTKTLDINHFKEHSNNSIIN